MSDQSGDRIHAPTPQRRQEARRQGQVARSQDLVSAGLLLGGLMLLLMLGGGLVDFFQHFAQRQWGGRAWLRVDPDFAVGQLQDVVLRTGVVVLPVLCLLLAIAVLIQVGQVGILFLPQKLQWDASRINPLQGLRKLFSRASAVRLSLGLVKVMAVTSVSAMSVWSQRGEIVALTGLETAQIAGALTSIVLGVCIRIAVALIVLALLDYAYQRWQHEQDLRMTTQELRDELRSHQGDPRLAAHRREIQRSAAVEREDTTDLPPVRNTRISR